MPHASQFPCNRHGNKEIPSAFTVAVAMHAVPPPLWFDACCTTPPLVSSICRNKISHFNKKMLYCTFAQLMSRGQIAPDRPVCLTCDIPLTGYPCVQKQFQPKWVIPAKIKMGDSSQKTSGGAPPPPIFPNILGAHENAFFLLVHWKFCKMWRVVCVRCGGLCASK